MEDKYITGHDPYELPEHASDCYIFRTKNAVYHSYYQFKLFGWIIEIALPFKWYKFWRIIKFKNVIRIFNIPRIPAGTYEIKIESHWCSFEHKPKEN